jgi:ribosome biogenesis GTPase / thiamine phosphate phosphatase
MISQSLSDLGWSARFLGQLSLDELETLTPLRLAEVHRDRAVGVGPDGAVQLTFPPDLPAGDTAVGDWILADPATFRIARVLDRTTELARRAAGREGRRQLIAANVDTLFVVSSCNADFNVPRLERYLAMAFEAGTSAVVVLTKADATDDPEDYAARARAVSHRVADVVTLDAREPAGLGRLSPWLGRGQTVVFLGSSGVGKSTLIAGLAGQDIVTRAIREDDAKGRHTTTARTIYRTPGGALVIDTPGMRELGLQDAAEGIDAVFDDIADLAATCRFSDCAHEAEPGCAVLAAVEQARLDPDRLDRWRKLQREDALASEALHARHRRERAFGRVVRQALDLKRRT